MATGIPDDLRADIRVLREGITRIGEHVARIDERATGVDRRLCERLDHVEDHIARLGRRTEKLEQRVTAQDTVASISSRWRWWLAGIAATVVASVLTVAVVAVLRWL